MRRPLATSAGAEGEDRDGGHDDGVVNGHLEARGMTRIADIRRLGPFIAGESLFADGG